jgi:hypothetical protein
MSSLAFVLVEGKDVALAWIVVGQVQVSKPGAGGM